MVISRIRRRCSIKAGLTKASDQWLCHKTMCPVYLAIGFICNIIILASLSFGSRSSNILHYNFEAPATWYLVHFWVSSGHILFWIMQKATVFKFNEQHVYFNSCHCTPGTNYCAEAVWLSCPSVLHSFNRTSTMVRWWLVERLNFNSETERSGPAGAVWRNLYSENFYNCIIYVNFELYLIVNGSCNVG